ncbi:uncharacterized protein LOC112519562 [Cynara cardunculus var. scolymus]|uniref:Uncharacterized protein n=1 Tax=Cynara cardunculus var. scolymus TaxID=59895 RepID=A0A118K019_CYNCS|nr:uncharacterized protein LOC112519562 [Cynara cardunculus var. scolymus]XP_024983529.1 uncharacterized protein LOC112519562 [Cynara cardunculus var. scolymus]KVI00707.1 hypothetical protein Ccrd_021040 [Cynara cardunculus var. scolymus]
MTSSQPTLHHYQMTITGDDSTTTATTPSTSETNWTVLCGSLDSAVTFESFDFPIDSEFTARKPPLLLLPPSSSDFEPCEIKLNFTQKHEIRQVYVRSTARVYEIYYAPALQSENEYLCTVRCSAASVEDNLFPATDVKEATSVNLLGANGILRKGRVPGENNIGSNEDDWVEVKLPVGRVDDGNTYLPNQTSNNIRNHQDFYEATAEINDSEPCISLTLRLLSLQSKGCVYVDEVYVFADPIDTNDSENQTVNVESSAGSSLMTMLVPTLLGLSKSRSLQLHDQHNSKSLAKPIEIESEPATSTNPVNHSDQHDEKLLKQSEDKAELSQFQVPASALASVPEEDKVCDLTRRNGFSYNRAESLLEQLVSRVSRIEDICMRFEESMLKPINNMEARLQHVEQQVELLAKNTRCPVSPSCLSLGPNPRSISNDGSHFQFSGGSDSEKEGSVSNETNKLPKGTQVHEGLMATDLESPCCDEKEEVNDVSESPKKEKPKKSISIDDALAAALAGFSSFTKADDSHVVAPLESPEEESLNSNQAPIDTTLVSNSNGDASICCGSLNATASELREEDEDTTKSNESLNVSVPESTTSCDASTEIPDDSFCLQETSKEATDPTHENHKSDADLGKQDSIRAVNFDKSDILKHFPDQSQDAVEVKDGSESIDFESSILEVKFSSSENSSLISGLESLLFYTDDPTTDEGVLITPKLNVCDLEDKTTTSNANDLLVELNGDHGGEEMQQDLPPVQQETSFASLI